MNNKNVIVILFLIAIPTALLGGFFIKKFFSQTLYKDIVLEDDLLISSEWKEIDTQNLIKIEKDNHFVSILLEPSFEANTPKGGILIPSGEIVNPEIKLVDEDGNEYLLTYKGSRGKENGKEIANYGYKGSLPIDKIYKKVLLRSDYPIKAKKILWSGYDAKDLR